MRLIDASSIGLLPFSEMQAPKYAILSHTWGDEEVTFSDLQSLSRGELQKRKGWRKILFAASQAKKDGYDYVWVDTCCIDKSSSAELNEAINSMFRWYRNAAACYAYLSDVGPTIANHQPWEDLELSISQSRWFTRGWTLQELIAPRILTFFNYAWTSIGTREEFIAIITKTTGIPREVCLDPDTATRFSIAQRMSWAAKRQTTRTEDTAYCLLGLFDINMPILYGEGSQAFIRLQRQIMKRTPDLSLFAWEGDATPNLQVGGLLAEHPSAFAQSGKIVLRSEGPEGLCVLRSKSLLICLPSLAWTFPWKSGTGVHAIALLPCYSIDRPFQVLGLPLTKPQPEQPWKRIWGRSRNLVEVTQIQLDQAEIQTIELEVNFDSNQYNYLEYHGRVNFSNLLLGDWNRWTGSEQQTLWNSALHKTMQNFKLKNHSPNQNWVALTISVSDTERWDGFETSTGQTGFDTSQHIMESASEHQQDFRGEEIQELLSGTTSDSTTIENSTGCHSRDSADDVKSLYFQQKALIPTRGETNSIINIQHAEACTRVHRDLEIRSSGIYESNRDDTKCWPDHEILSNVIATGRTDDSEALYKDEEEHTSIWEEEENDEDDNGVDDCESIFSDVEPDDADIGDKETPFLSILVDAFVEVILERYDTISKMEDIESGQANEQHYTPCSRDELLSTSTEHNESRRSGKRKANQESHDDCEERQHSRARSE